VKATSRRTPIMRVLAIGLQFLLIVACAGPVASPARPTAVVAATATVVRSAAAVTQTPTRVLPTAHPTPTLPALVDTPVFPYTSSVDPAELPAKVPYRVAHIRKYGPRWEVAVQAPLAEDAAHAMSVALEVTNEMFGAAEPPRVLMFGVYSQDPIKAMRDPYTADPDLAEGFASRDRRGYNGDGTWSGVSFYTFNTPFGDAPFRDEGKVYVAIPVYDSGDKRQGATSMQLFAIDGTS
jgi:hypothetical protein